MNNILSIVKIGLISSLRGKVSTGKKKNRKPLLIVLLIIAFIPLMGSFAELTRILYNAFETIGQGDVVLVLSLFVASVMAFILGIFFTMGSYYMSKDVPTYLSMPIKPWEITAARFILVLVYEYMVMLFFLLPILIGFGIAASKGVLFYLIGVVVFLVLPILPLSLASIIVIIIMSFAKKSLNKDRFSMISGLIALVIAIGFNFGFQRIATDIGNPENAQDLINSGQFSFAETVSKYFPGLQNASKALSQIDWFNLLIFIAMGAIAFVAFLFVARLLYFKGVIGINQQASKKDFNIEKTGDFASKKPLGSYLIKELKLIFRTPIYFMNLVLIDILLPVLMVVPILFSVGSTEFTQLMDVLRKMTSDGIVVTGTFVIFVFISAMNGITATAISREGNQLYIMKHIPLSYKDQMNAKLLSGMAVSGTGMVILVIIIGIVLNISLPMTVLMLLAGLNAVIFTRLTGLLIDSANPKLKWDDEQKAVKQNTNLLYNMLIGMVAAAGGVLFIIYVGKSLTLNTSIFIGGMAILNYVLYIVLAKRFPIMLERIE